MKHKIIIIVLLLAVIFTGALTPNLGSETEEPSTIITNTNNNEVSLGPTVDNICISSENIYNDSDYLGESIGHITKGETVKTISISDGWAKVNYNDQLAYINADSIIESDKYLLAQICFAEAGGTTKSEMAKVGQVVLNRVDSQYWEFQECHSILDVVSQDGQYPETLDKIRNGLEPSEEAIEVARGLLNGTLNSGLSADVLWQTGFVPTWNAQVVLETEWHYYSVLKED